MKIDVNINNGVLNEYEYLFKELDRKSLVQAPILMGEINERFKNELSYKIEIRDESKKLYMLSIVAYRRTPGKTGDMLVYRTKGNLIYDGFNVLDDGCLKNILEKNEKLEFRDYSEINYRKMVRVINRLDIDMDLDDERKDKMTKEQFYQLGDALPIKRPYIDMVDFAFDIEIFINLEG